MRCPPCRSGSDRPLGELDLVLGTSAGGVLGAALRCGMGVDELLAHQHGADAVDRAARHAHHRARDRRRACRRCRCRGSGRRGSWPRAVAHPCTVNPVIAASAPAARGPGADGVADPAGRRCCRRGWASPSDGWVPGAPLWVVAVDYDSGRRTVFGRAGRPAVDGRGGRAGLVLDPGLVHAAGDRRAPLRRRRGGVVHVAGAAGAAGCAAAGRGVRARAAGQPRLRPAARPDRGRRARCPAPVHALAGRRGAGRAGGGRPRHRAHPGARGPRGDGRQPDEPAAPRAGAGDVAARPRRPRSTAALSGRGRPTASWPSTRSAEARDPQRRRRSCVYERVGPPDGEPLLLVMGLGMQMLVLARRPVRRVRRARVQPWPGSTTATSGRPRT